MITGTVYCANPFVAVYDDICDAETAQRIIDRYTRQLEPAEVVGMTGRIHSEHRTNTEVYLDAWGDEDVAAIGMKVASILRLPPENAEPAKLLHYVAEQEFKPHVDAFNSYTPGHIEALRNGGQRLFTSLLYLNTPGAGGVTAFPRLKMEVKPRLGRMLLFGHTMAGTNEPHPHSLHAGTAAREGEKYVISTRWREDVYVERREYPAEDGDVLIV